MADKIADVTSGSEICSNHVKTKVPETSTPNDCISNLQAQISELSLKIDRMSQFRRSRSMSRRNNYRARSASRKDQMCWYHFRFRGQWRTGEVVSLPDGKWAPLNRRQFGPPRNVGEKKRRTLSIVSFSKANK
ncbi:hypothetical protein AVEN_128131-1 [Araneus ventricosus]|uniref:Uncharacterized protein n=1 Tax=Araneus ventricosus TaxID=182803 RepID=A0A4Y2A0P9_ARAVE|nr:hypothetical protein AVEN_128131-1 [Araneus ventricosus]